MMKRLTTLGIPLFAALAVTLIAYAEKTKQEKVGWIDPVTRNIEGWTVTIDPALLSGEHKEEGDLALKMLENHLERIAILVPERPLADLRKVGIQIEHQHPELGNMQYHPGKRWLEGKGYDPSLVKKVHIPVAKNLFSRQQMLKHPAVILHELAHGYHDQFLSFDNPEILDAYNSAMEKGNYKKVMLFDGRKVVHYATTNHKEYFAEATEAFLYRNDFYPFVAGELKAHDPKAFELMGKIWGE
ncbi:MAG: metallopeptidase [Akkermansiaceae bacterium]